jgi:hypothetical protein
MADEAAEFWNEFERETGEKVESRCIGEYYRNQDPSYGLWGLLVLTDKSFRFKHMPSENWLSSLFKRAGRPSAPKEPVEITIPRGEIVSVNSPKRDFFARVFGPAFPRLTITGSDEKTYLFTLDPSGGFLTALEHAISRQESRPSSI